MQDFDQRLGFLSPQEVIFLCTVGNIAPLFGCFETRGAFDECKGIFKAHALSFWFLNLAVCT